MIILICRFGEARLRDCEKGHRLFVSHATPRELASKGGDGVGGEMGEQREGADLARFM